MSRWIDIDLEKGLVKESISSMDECQHMCNEVCCNEQSQMLGGFVVDNYCRKKCPYFLKEDGIITDR